MLALLRQKLAARKAKQRLKRHFASAEGSHTERTLIAIAMTAIESEMVEHEQSHMPEEQRSVFVTAYACFVLWVLKRSIEAILSTDDTKSAVMAMKNNFRKRAWYEVNRFEKIWTAIEELMPSALVPKGELRTVYPLAEITLAANIAGFPLNPPLDYRFGAYVIMTIDNLTKTGQQVAKAHIAESR